MQNLSFLAKSWMDGVDGKILSTFENSFNLYFNCNLAFSVFTTQQNLWSRLFQLPFTGCRIGAETK